MLKINEIQNCILELEGGTYQKLLDAYLYKKYNYKNIVSLGSETGTRKTTKGTPDSYVLDENNKYILINYGTVKSSSVTKIKKDIIDCLDFEKTSLHKEEISKIICCHTSSNISLKDHKEICSLFDDVLLIGIDELSQDLYLNYPILARDFLDVNVDTGQIRSIEEFYELQNDNKYLTPLDMPTLCREKEIQEIKDLLNINKCIVIFGNSGSGKTKLALAVAEAYSHGITTKISVIKSNGTPIFDDLKTYFLDGQQHLIVIDDANELNNLNWLLDLTTNDLSKENIKIIMTVRDYAKYNVIKFCKEYKSVIEYSINPLSSDQIKTIISNNMKINSAALLDRIANISGSNVRLAIMAAECAKQGNFDKVSNVFDLYSYHYSRIIESLNIKELQVASIIAFFGSFILNNDSTPFVLLNKLGINYDEFIELSLILNGKEIIDIYNNKRAMRFEDQNLRDYLIYCMFFENKFLSPSELILCSFPEYRERIVFVFNCLIDKFSSKENNLFLESEIKKAWDEYKQKNEFLLEYVETFHSVIPDQSLLFVKQQINEINEYHENLVLFNFDKHSNYHNIESPLIKILINFKNLDLFNNAIELAYSLFLKNSKHPMDLYFLFKKEWSISRHSYDNNYEKENELIDFLIEHYDDSNDVSVFSLFFFCSSLLDYDYSSTEQNKSNSINIYNFNVVSCEGLFKLRNKVFKALSILSTNEKVQKMVFDCLNDYPTPNSEDEINIFNNDLVSLLEYFEFSDYCSNFDKCIILNRFENICNCHKISIPENLYDCNNNKCFSIYRALRKDYSSSKSYDEIEKKQENEISKKIKNISVKDVKEFLFELTKRNENDWDLSDGLSMFFSYMCEYDEKLFFDSLNLYIDYGTPNDECCYRIIEAVLNKKGYSYTIDYLNAKSFAHKEKWMCILFNYAQEIDINDKLVNLIMNSNAGDDYFFPVRLDIAKRINNIFPNFILSYINKLQENTERKSFYVFHFLQSLGHLQDISIEEFCGLFSNSKDKLIQLYCDALCGGSYFDYEGKLLLSIVHKYPSTISLLIKNSIEINNIALDNLSILWNDANYIELISNVIDATFESKNNPYISYYTSVEHLLSSVKANDEKYINWLNQYICLNCHDIDKMKFLFNNICSLQGDFVYNAIICFCSFNKSFEDFSKIHITPNHSSWSGSEVPIIDKRIELLSKIKDKLNGFDYIEHRNYLEDIINQYIKRKENVLLDEFLSNN